MSERYGTPGEVNEMFGWLEDQVRENIDRLIVEMKHFEASPMSYNAGYVMALRDVLDWMGVSTK